MEDPSDRIRSIERDFKRQARRLRPSHFLRLVQAVMREAERSREVAVRYPPHKVAHLLEASCAYYAGRNDLQLNPDRLHSLLADLKELAEPTYNYLLREKNDLFEFILLMGRSQFGWQNNMGPAPLGRFSRMFCGIPFERYQKIIPLAFEDILRSVFVISTSPGKPYRRAGIDPRALELCKLDNTSFDKFLELFSTTPQAIKREYLRRRREVRPMEWPHLRSILEERPVVVENDLMFVPFMGWAVNLLNEGVHHRFIGATSDDLLALLSRRWEQYCEDVLGRLPSVELVVPGNKLLVSGQPSADHAVVLPDAIIVADSKFLRLERRWATARAVFDCTDDIAYGMHQVVRTAQRIRDGHYEELRQYADRPIFGCVLLFTAPPLLNTEDAWKGCWDSRLGRYGVTREDWRDLLVAPPQLLAANDLEALCMGMHAKGYGLTEVVAEKLGNADSFGSDWHNFIHRNRDISVCKPLHAYWTEASDIVLGPAPPLVS